MIIGNKVEGIKSYRVTYGIEVHDATIEELDPQPKYKVVVGSDSGHCCFQYTVMGVTRNESICECFDLESAQMIADSLNV